MPPWTRSRPMTTTGSSASICSSNAEPRPSRSASSGPARATTLSVTPYPEALTELADDLADNPAAQHIVEAIRDVAAKWF